MILIEGKEQFEIPGRTAVTIGKFDGVHRGHRKILDSIFAKKKEGLLTAVFTFDPSPAVFFGSGEKELMTREEKRRFFEAYGVDVLVEYPMNARSASVSPEYFVRQILSKQMHAKYIAAGNDLSYGAGGKGNFALLNALSEELDYTAEEISKKMWHGQEIGSTLVRRLVELGELREAGELLGTPYGILCEKAEALGDDLILEVSERKLLPPARQYKVLVQDAAQHYEDPCGEGTEAVLRIEKDRLLLRGIHDTNRQRFISFMN